MTDGEKRAGAAPGDRAPRPRVRLLAFTLAVLIGALLGAGLFTVVYAEGLSYDEEELVARAERIQERTRELLDAAETATVELIRAIEAAADEGATDDRLAEARTLQRRAQWLTDFVNAENSRGFHSAQEQARNLARAVDFARRGIAETLRVRAGL